MVEIPKFNGKDLKSPFEDKISKKYCEFVRNFFFDQWGPSNDTPSFKKIHLLGFILYLNRHIDFLKFMNAKESWAYLNSLTGTQFHVFSINPSKKGVLTDNEEKSIHQLLDIFELEKNPKHPYLVLSDFKMEQKTLICPMNIFMMGKSMGFQLLKLAVLKIKIIQKFLHVL